MGDYNNFDDISIKDIFYLYELRHAMNVFGARNVANEMKVSEKILNILYSSDIHGSNEVLSVIENYSNNKEKCFKEIKELENEHYKILQEKEDRFQENQELICDLSEMRTKALGIGTNKIKRRLNKLAKASAEAAAIRIALEIEDKNILAKDTYGKYVDKIYKQKHELIIELIVLFKENNWIFGRQDSDVFAVSDIIYFEIPGTEQISWHADLSSHLMVPEYNKEWDEKINSTLPKIMNKIKKDFNEIIY